MGLFYDYMTTFLFIQRLMVHCFTYLFFMVGFRNIIVDMVAQSTGVFRMSSKIFWRGSLDDDEHSNIYFSGESFFPSASSF